MTMVGLMGYENKQLDRCIQMTGGTNLMQQL